jgi:phosphatidylserine decarboxylase
MSSNEIKFFNRGQNKYEVEKVYGDKAIQFIYTNPIGKVVSSIISRSPLSKVYGKAQDSYLSKNKVRPFIKDFNIPIDDYLPGTDPAKDIRDSYKNFNEFFIRQFAEGKRPFVKGSELGGFAEARYVGFDSMTPEEKFPVKGEFLNSHDLLKNTKWGDTFKEGPLLIGRLCPVDYHRYHYPDSGKTLDSYTINGDYYSVNPLALKFKGDIFIKNERRVSILETENFGKLAYIEVGATMVGKIVQSHNEDEDFKRGEQKGYFLFGASTVVVLGEKGKWVPSKDITENTQKGLETYVQLGDQLGNVL